MRPSKRLKLALVLRSRRRNSFRFLRFCFRTWVWSSRSKLYQTRHSWSDSIRGVGLTSDKVEPCIYQGVVNAELALLVAYVDDLLLCCQSERAEKIVEKAIGKPCP